MRKLTEQPGNEFTPKIKDIILPKQMYTYLNFDFWQKDLSKASKSNNLKKIASYLQKEYPDITKGTLNSDLDSVYNLYEEKY